MTAPTQISWTDLFETNDPAEITISLRVLNKGGEPFLILPQSPTLAARALSLYPAQTNFARAAKTALDASLRFGFSSVLKKTARQFSHNDPFARFLLKIAGGKSKAFPPLAILCGNPRVEGRRFIVLLFDAAGRPSVVVKAGIDESARRLVQKEKSFLESVPENVPGMLKLLAGFNSARVEALAVAYVDGDSPGAGDWQDAGRLLTGWLDNGTRVGADEIPAWRAVQSAHGADPQFRRVAASLAGCTFSAALFHGDFAPWNIKVSRADGSWTAVDWERGELSGFPGWDWFHYVVQTGILVEKLPPQRLIAKLEGLFNAPTLRAYAQASGIQGREKVLAAAYLFYCVKVLRQTEGFATAEALLAAACGRWLG